MRLLLVDNYDSFTFNLVQAFAVLGADVDVVKNDDEAPHDPLHYDGLVLSPGPCSPNEAGICAEMLRRFAPHRPVLGVCLGHQVIGACFGGTVVRTEPVHGKTRPVFHDGQGVFHNLPSPFLATRYNSLHVAHPLPDTLEVSAEDPQGQIQGLRHRRMKIDGVQFHPESVASEHGLALLDNWLRLVVGPRRGNG